MLEVAPPGTLAGDTLHVRGFARQIGDQHPEPSVRERVGPEEPEVDTVETEEVGLDRVAVPVE